VFVFHGLSALLQGPRLEHTVELRFYSERVSGAVQKQQAMLFSFWVTVSAPFYTTLKSLSQT
jgi:hypothetical protein